MASGVPFKPTNICVTFTQFYWLSRLLPGTRFLQAHLYHLCPRPGICHFSLEPLFLLVGNGIYKSGSIWYTPFKPRLWPLPIGLPILSSPPNLHFAPPLGSRPWPGLQPEVCYPLSRVLLEHNESAWGRLWLEVPDSAAPDSVVVVTVTAMGREASSVPPTHAFLRLLVLAPAPQVRQPHFPSQGTQGKGRAV